jgi:quercetin dioxygenase-like cupin family protein
MTILATAADTGGAYGLMEQEAARGFRPPIHCHAHEDDAYLVLEGELTFRLDGEDRRAGPGDHVFLPRGLPHTFRVDSKHARWLELVTPGGVEQWHHECSDPADDDGLPPAAPIDIERVLQTIGPYGVDIVGPPMEAVGAETH